MDDDLPPFPMIEFLFGEHDAALTVMSRDNRFHVYLTTEDLHGPRSDEAPV
jgi:hypothetical protein